MIAKNKRCTYDRQDMMTTVSVTPNRDNPHPTKVMISNATAWDSSILSKKEKGLPYTYCITSY